MPTLEFVTELNPPPLEPGSAGVEVWRDNEGRACAFGRADGSESWMRVPGAGTFRFGHASGTVQVAAEEPASREVVIDTYYRTVLPMALQAEGLEVLHASAVTTPWGVAALCAPSETGKSTLAFELHRRGHRLYADDAVVFDASAGSPVLIQIPFAIRLRRASADYFGEASRESVRVAHDSTANAADEPRLAAVCVLERMGVRGDRRAGGVAQAGGSEAAAVVDRLAPAAAFAALLPHAYCFSLADPDRKGSMMRHYLGLAESVPVLRLRFRTGLQHLTAILDELEAGLALVAANAGAAPVRARNVQLRENTTLF